MSEEVPFKSIKITLSEEAVDMLTRLRKTGFFRSDSMTIEECIRAIDSMANQISGYLAYLARQKRPARPEETLENYKDLISRMVRFIPREIWDMIRSSEGRSSVGT